MNKFTISNPGEKNPIFTDLIHNIWSKLKEKLSKPPYCFLVLIISCLKLIQIKILYHKKK